MNTQENKELKKKKKGIEPIVQMVCKTVWNFLVSKLALVRLNDQDDVFKLSAKLSGTFTVKSMYNSLMNQGFHGIYRYLWK